MYQVSDKVVEKLKQVIDDYGLINIKKAFSELEEINDLKSIGEVETMNSLLSFVLCEMRILKRHNLHDGLYRKIVLLNGKEMSMGEASEFLFDKFTEVVVFVLNEYIHISPTFVINHSKGKSVKLTEQLRDNISIPTPFDEGIALMEKETLDRLSNTIEDFYFMFIDYSIYGD